ncbi:hypothetical protein C9374_000268 [Naegleria lovaniensis]|uniref:Peptidase S1 domain-containing protein n=1 Tax=Naegleria lovaniensis TaxID=51637 RepID=A0AA88GZH0_NAELO|nr:uncharacterized protein C9374_000268 [Naegleria lovaniensis]KAG2388829.1 hypothetical protein C9374_000268 [Naegleria lovaniensis]
MSTHYLLHYPSKPSSCMMSVIVLFVYVCCCCLLLHGHSHERVCSSSCFVSATSTPSTLGTVFKNIVVPNSPKLDQQVQKRPMIISNNQPQALVKFLLRHHATTPEPRAATTSTTSSLQNSTLPQTEDNIKTIHETRIMGGRQVLDEHAYPHMASLQLVANERGYHLCGASLIDKKWLVSASHCFFDESGSFLDPENLSIVIGNSNLSKCPGAKVENSRRPRYGCIRRKVHRFITHPLYDSKVVVNDIALIELEEEVEFSTSIRPIQIPDYVPLVGTELTLTGWGHDPSEKTKTVLLEQVSFPLMKEDACTSIGLRMSVRKGQVCAGSETGDACSGDSGSPLLLPLGSCASDSKFYCYSIVGLVSYGISCSNTRVANRVGVYTSVPYFKKWIQQNAQVGQYNEDDLDDLRKNNDTSNAISMHRAQQALFLSVVISLLFNMFIWPIVVGL